MPLGEVLVQNTEYVNNLEPMEYPKLSVKLYGRGVELDGTAEGASVKMNRHQLATPGQVIVSEIWAKKGAIGLVPAQGAGALCTSHFFLFDVDERRVHRGWLKALFWANYLGSRFDEQAKGTTTYAAIRPKHFLAAKIPLPPLAQQRRIVAKIEHIAAKIDEARALQQAVQTEATALCRAVISPEHCDSVETVRVDELVTLREPDVNVRVDEEYHFAGVYSFGRGVFRGEARPGLECSYKRLTRLRVNDFVYPKLMAWEGAFGVVSEDCAGLVVSPEFPVFEIDKSRALPEFFDVYFSDPNVWPTLPSKGTNVRRRRLHPDDFADYALPLPDLNSQYRLRVAKTKVDRLKALQAQTRAELDALLPAILDRAFKGEL